MPKLTRNNWPIAASKGGALLFLLCCLSILRPPLVFCEPVLAPEYEVKLGFIYNFINFVSWPPGSFEESPENIIVCIASDDSSSDTLYRLNGKSVKGKIIQVIPYQKGACVEQSHVLFFATQNTKIIQQALELAEGQSILTIGEVEGFTQMGGVMNFFKDRNRLRFEINTTAARRNALKMSSQLLGSAQIVEEGSK